MPSLSLTNKSTSAVYTSLMENHHAIDRLYKANDAAYNGRSVELAVLLQKHAFGMQSKVDSHAAFLASKAW